ncbi:hypothetical protein [Paracoccus sp. (in: a-proteobacteria)]|uniref:hypothetical protein n=1 Tax=Paracoccus sp. TaxID=267 RepID=UPI003A890113
MIGKTPAKLSAHAAILAAWAAEVPLLPERLARGYAQLYDDHVLHATDGCDLDFLRAP